MKRQRIIPVLLVGCCLLASGTVFSQGSTGTAKSRPLEIGVTVKVSNASELDVVKPSYPGEFNTTGSAVVRVRIDRSGKVVSAQVLSGHALMRSHVVDAARKTTFKPNSTRVSKYVTGTITYTFTFPVLSYDDLHSLIGRQVTLRGEFSLRGKIAPFVSVSGRPVYLVGRNWGEHYSDTEGKLVIVSGTLRFFRAGPPPDSSDSPVARVPDHFYLKAEGMTLELARQ